MHTNNATHSRSLTISSQLSSVQVLYSVMRERSVQRWCGSSLSFNISYTLLHVRLPPPLLLRVRSHSNSSLASPLSFLDDFLFYLFLVLFHLYWRDRHLTFFFLFISCIFFCLTPIHTVWLAACSETQRRILSFLLENLVSFSNNNVSLLFDAAVFAGPILRLDSFSFFS